MPNIAVFYVIKYDEHTLISLFYGDNKRYKNFGGG